ncbi:unnamed protein product [Symbiodinium sp. CCMP2592]|nr:unnamed protein product [Symbiodinium sp. CCMP2592]
MHREPTAPLVNKRRIEDLLKVLKRMTLNDNITAFEDVLPERVLQSFQDLRQACALTCDASLTSPKAERSLKEALEDFPLRAPALSWFL